MTEYFMYPPYNTIDGDVVLAAEKFLEAVGIGCATEHTYLTPHRLIHYLQYLLADDNGVRLTAFKNENPFIDHMVIVPRIPFWSACTHHCLPFTGEVSVGYIPGKLIIGLSKVPLMVRTIARGFWMQEHLAHKIADKLDEVISPRGIGVHIRAMHTCQLLDLKQPPIPEMVTTVLRGLMLMNPAAKQEFLMEVKCRTQ